MCRCEIEREACCFGERAELAGGCGDRPKASRRSRYAVIAGVALVIVAGLALGVIPRLRAQSKLVAATQEVTLRTVTVTNATRLASSVQLALPGDVRAFEETKIYARADGYLLKWNSDIGAKVEAGQVLAEIDTPELDQELLSSFKEVRAPFAGTITSARGYRCIDPSRRQCQRPF